MRKKKDVQSWLDSQGSNLKLTNEYFARYEAISEILDCTPALLERVHRDLRRALEAEIEQVEGGFITGYEAFEVRPAGPSLIGPALANHEELFGQAPVQLTADKGYSSREEIEEILDRVQIVGIPKKGGRNRAELEREHDPLFRMAQAFRAGIEGSISFLKRCLGLARCLTKGWQHPGDDRQNGPRPQPADPRPMLNRPSGKQPRSFAPSKQEQVCSHRTTPLEPPKWLDWASTGFVLARITRLAPYRRSRSGILLGPPGRSKKQDLV